MGNKHKYNRRCLECNKIIIDNSKTGYCNIHRDRTGQNNSFYGKHHTLKNINVIKEKTRIESKKKWLDKLYRDKVIKGTSKPRREGFKSEQSDRITQWYIDNPEQREIRRKSMKENWIKGIITKKNNFSYNESKIEKKMFKNLKNIYPNIKKITITNGKNWFFPDMVSTKDGIIIEFFGNYWHANPELYKSEDIVRNNMKACDLWKNDEIRIEKLKKLGYHVIVVWEKEYKENKNLVLKRFNELLNWESCSL